MTKDGDTPILGTQEIFMLDFSGYEQVKLMGTILKREEIRNLASHSFTIKGYKKLK